MSKVAMLGAGSWGTALALVLADNTHQVKLWGKDDVATKEINENHTNSRYLGESVLPKSLVATTSLEEAVKDVDVIVFAVPTKAIREVASKLQHLLNKEVLFVHVSKGIEPGTSKRISEMIREEISNDLIRDIVILSGPSHAEEVVLRHPTTITAACENIESANEVQDLFSNHYFRVYTNADVIGVELGGALKNIVAFGVGVIDGLGYGDNAKAAIITRGLAEITRLGVRLGAHPLTFAGLSGLGDLIVTCTSVHSRNWRAGNMVGKGMSLDEVLDSMGMVVEGVRTTKAAFELAEKYEVDMPITATLYEVLYENKSVKDCVDQLMNRDLRNEMSGLYQFLQ